MIKNYIHPYPEITSTNLNYMLNRVGNTNNQMHYSIKEINRQTQLYRSPEIMDDVEHFPNTVKLDHNEIARKLLDTV